MTYFEDLASDLGRLFKIISRSLLIFKIEVVIFDPGFGKEEGHVNVELTNGGKLYVHRF